MRKQTTVNFSEIFNFAKEAPFNLDWNACSDMFFKEEVLTYKGTNELYKEGLIADLKYNEAHPESKYPPSKKEILAKKVLIAFMEAHKLEEMLVLND